MSLDSYLQTHKAIIENALEAALPPPSTQPTRLHQGMHYALMGGGKRLRPILCLSACAACGGNTEAALLPAVAVEMMHTYSLVHDDLPAMDDDSLRRGRATCHVKFGEATAILIGDALLTQSFATIARTPGNSNYPPHQFVAELAQAGGSKFLIAGQIEDLAAEGKNIELTKLRQIHEMKTAALLTCALRCGAMAANASEAQLENLTRFGQALGLAFQIIDDILDETQATEQLGKTAGKDQTVQKSTYPSLMGLEQAKAEARQLTQQALDALIPFGDKAKYLIDLSKSMLQRNC